MLSVLEIIKRTTDFFAGKKIENPRLNAEHIVGHALGLARMQLYLQFERLLTEGELETIRPLVRRRGQREPLQYVLGETEFGGLTLKTDRRALIPRPETELLVEIVATRLAAAPPASILDLGTGSGALALALAKRFEAAHVVGTDKSAAALELARENAAGTGLVERTEWIESDWFDRVPRDRRFDLIVANPPYLSTAEAAVAAPEVRDYEPSMALVGGGLEGLADLLVIIAGAPAHLTAGGTLAVETGIAQHPQLLEAARRAGFPRAESQRDLTGRDRFIVATH